MGSKGIEKDSESQLVMSDPMDFTVHGILQARILEWVPLPSLGGFPNPGSNTGLPHYRQILYQAEPQGKPKNTGVGSLSLLQRICLNQESNLGSPALQTDSLPAEPPGKPQGTEDIGKPETGAQSLVAL